MERKKRGDWCRYSIKNVEEKEPMEKRPDVGKWRMEGCMGIKLRS